LEIILIELLLWAGLIFFFWALRDGLNQVEADLAAKNQRKPASEVANSPAYFDRPDQLSEPIGRYRDTQIYRIAVIEGKPYHFQHILPWGSFSSLLAGERCIAPGLVYAMCQDYERC
jgi:hypothetical protein